MTRAPPVIGRTEGLMKLHFLSDGSQTPRKCYVTNESKTPSGSPEVRSRLEHSLRLDLVGPGPGDPLAEERLPAWERPSNRYLTGFLIPAATPPDKRADDDEEDDFDLVPETSGLVEES